MPGTTTEYLPLTPEELTPEWLSSALGFKVASLECTTKIMGTASKLFYTVHYDESETTPESDRPSQIVIKGGFDQALVKQLPPLLSFYIVESKFFNEIGPKLTGLRLPKCWFGADNKEQGIVVFDNWAVRGYTFGEPTIPMSVDMVKDAVEQLAALHAGNWGATNDQYPYMTKYSDTMMGMLQAVGYHDFVRDPSRPQLPVAYQDEARVRAMLEKYYASYNPKFRCLCHGDAHVGNTAIQPDGRVNFIDWQIMDIGSCFHDVSYFMGSALSVADRRASEMEILDHYLAALHRFGGPKFSRDEEDVMVEFKKAYLVGMGWAVTTTGMQPMARIEALLERFIACWEDHKVMELVESLPEPAAAQ